ncbi:glycosyltransferase family 4 protein [Sphingomonas sp. JC676]|uniref:glycosyltransferase n=1 Tax=Sphingomonas sp. JC676 TaxID=2768065 RepID=UPI00165850CD|nr:glycosyltransferase [Sphingomonas sp. JC676]MBC9030862.1 glycosyltransferase family 4 protein [Sphingomonas sp. JC676]
MPVAALAPWHLARAVRAENPDVVHLNGLEFPLHARALSAHSAPVLVQDHASHTWRRGLGRLRRWGYDRIAAASPTAPAQADPFLQTGQLPRDLPVFAIPECSSDFVPGQREEARYRIGVHGDPALLWIGHLNANKDPLTIVRAVAQALESMPNLELWVVFIGTELLREVETLLAAFPSLAARTHLLGHVPHDRIQDLCRACDLFVSGSHRHFGRDAQIGTGEPLHQMNGSLP